MSDRMQEYVESGRESLTRVRDSSWNDPVVPRLIPACAMTELLASEHTYRRYIIIGGEPGTGKRGAFCSTCGACLITSKSKKSAFGI